MSVNNLAFSRLSLNDENLVTAPWTMDNLDEKANAILKSLPRDQKEAMSDAIRTAESILYSALGDNETRALKAAAEADVNEFMNIEINDALNRRMAGWRANVSGGKKRRSTKRRSTKRRSTRRRSTKRRSTRSSRS
jgi:hypothetical protein